MEIINKATPGFAAYNGKQAKEYISFQAKNIFFSKKTCAKFQIKKGMFVHFVTDIDRLYFFVNDDENGLSLFSDNYRNALRCAGQTISHILKKKFPHITFTGQLPIRECPTKLNDNKLIEVLIHKRIIK